MIILRPARLSDLSQLERLAKESGTMVSTLPDKKESLVRKIERSVASFAQDVVTPGEESYFFVLEESLTGQVVGTGAINALSGYRAPFYAFRNDMLIHSSRELNVHSRVHALSLTHDLSDHSNLCSFYVVASLLKTLYPALITLGRLLYMSVEQQRFTNEWMAVLPGLCDEKGRAPFWEHVGRKFVGLNYDEVEFLNNTKESTFIAELMPHYPLYVPLFDEEAQLALGMVNPKAELQCNLLSGQGFEPDKYVEIFDGGPILSATRSTLSIWQEHRQATLSLGAVPADAELHLIGFNTDKGFVAFISPCQVKGDKLKLESAVAKQVGLKSKLKVWHIAL
ncbi:arginine N-succinyltransferase [Vibrio tritonius]|uniref:Arginine N-succinyltransferase n=1 Tax=Vibrio tritonius TaxID=1435069 RepID=A0ABS7YTU4_9VIBR|nr:arginine N-succinyltransferase [Vibrio tritonius]MCA2018793.1 arginine N-succinyltransferase [Vibrio tritonius]